MTVENFNSSDTWICPDGVFSVTVECVGGGGGGGGSVTLGHGGCGGRGGDYSTSTLDVTPGSSYDITIGSGGSAGPYNSGGGAAGHGTSSIFGSNLVVAAGGKGGNYTQAGTDPNGTSIGSTINSGSSGVIPTFTINGAGGAGGTGGTPLGGAGGAGGVGSSPATNPTPPGGGGGGGRGSSSAYPASNGAIGLIRLTYTEQKYGDVIVSGSKKKIARISVIDGGVKKNVRSMSVIQSGSKKVIS